MSWSVRRSSGAGELPTPVPVPPAHPGAFDDAYVCHRDGEPQWQVLVSWQAHAGVPFRAEVCWEAAGIAALGGGSAVHLVALASGAPVGRIDLPSGFGHLGLNERDGELSALGWTEIVAIDQTLAVRWRARDVAVDGLVYRGSRDGVLHVAAEMDPPGGWFDVTLDAATGRELSRRPAFTEGYRGIHGTAG